MAFVQEVAVGALGADFRRLQLAEVTVDFTLFAGVGGCQGILSGAIFAVAVPVALIDVQLTFVPSQSVASVAGEAV